MAVIPCEVIYTSGHAWASNNLCSDFFGQLLIVYITNQMIFAALSLDNY